QTKECGQTAEILSGLAITHLIEKIRQKRRYFIMLNAKQEEIVIVGAARTPVGAYLGDLKTVPVEDLGEIALKEAVKRSNLDVSDIDEVIVGHVTGTQTTNNLGNIIAI